MERFRIVNRKIGKHFKTQALVKAYCGRLTAPLVEDLQRALAA